DNNPDFSSPEQTGYSAVCTNGTCLYYINPALMPGEYYWRVRADEAGWPWSDVWSFRLQGRVKKDAAEDGLPQSAELFANRPNPFNPKTAIRFALAEPGHVRLTVYNIMGQKVATLVDGHLNAGYHDYEWDGTRAASGIYLYRLETENSMFTRKMMLVK
ncbi:MAG: T9SS type A sorting domain-containing protein, partial [Candidatus Zixiibacteriota bacterium]